MNRLESPILTSDKASVEIGYPTDGRVCVRIFGVIDQAQPGKFLDPIVDWLHADALAHGWTGMDLDVRDLSFINSSGIKSFAGWIKKYMDTPAEGRYELSFIYKDTVTWQRATIKAFSAMSRGTVKVTAA